MKVAFVVSNSQRQPVEGLYAQQILTVRLLRELGHTVDLMGFCKNAEDVADGVELLPGSTLLRSIAALVPFTRAARAVRALRARLDGGNYDLVHANGALAAVVSRNGDRPTVVSWIDSQSRRSNLRVGLFRDPVRAAAAAATAAAYLVVERLVRSERSLWHYVSEVDADWARSAHPGQAITTIPICFEVSETPAGAAQAPPWESRIIVPCDLRQHYFRKDLEELLAALVDARYCGLRLVVVGRARRNRVRIPPELERSVSYVPWVQDLQAEMAGAGSVLLIDGFGTGLKNRTVEAVLSGAQVIATPAALEGLPSAFVQHVRRIEGAGDAPAALPRSADLARDRMMRRSAAIAEIAPFRPGVVRGRWALAYEEVMARPSTAKQHRGSPPTRRGGGWGR